jgi:hypothetical protein
VRRESIGGRRGIQLGEGGAKPITRQAKLTEPRAALCADQEVGCYFAGCGAVQLRVQIGL